MALQLLLAAVFSALAWRLLAVRIAANAGGRMFGSLLRPGIWQGHGTARRRMAGIAAALVAGTVGGLPALGTSASTSPPAAAAAPASVHWRTVFSDRFAGR